MRFLTAIGYLQLLAAPRAAAKAGKQRATLTDRAASQIALPIGIIADQLLIPLEFLPRDITIVMILDQNIPIGGVPPQVPADPLAASSIVTRALRRPNT